MAAITRREFIKKSLSILGLLSIPITRRTFASGGGAWPLLNEWNFEEFEKYSEWVHNIYVQKRSGRGKRKRTTLDEILKDNDANLLNDPYFLGKGNQQASDRVIDLMSKLTHCATLPKLLLLYYSYRRGLPAVVAKITKVEGGDIRYSVGNHPVRHIDSVSYTGLLDDYLRDTILGKDGGYVFCSGNFRTDPHLEGTDSVPIALDKKFLKPGSVAYNASGHVLVVGKISETGEVHFLDSHPDNSITFNDTTSAIYTVNPAKPGRHGLRNCYDGFRNMRLAKVDGRKARFFTNKEMIEFGYSIEQYKLMAELIAKVKKGEGLVVNDQKVKWYPYMVKARLRSRKEKPLFFLENTVEELDGMFQERAEIVQKAWKNVLEYGPIILPNDSRKANIYQAYDRWETWSSPSLDVEVRKKYYYILTTLEDMIVSFGKSGAYDYSGFSSKAGLVRALRKKKQELFKKHFIVYTNSVGGRVKLSLNNIEQRLFDLSFDPNHCPELRWGAPPNSDERKTMKLLRTPLRTGEILDALKAYELERGLRYNLTRQNTPTSLNPKKNPKEPLFGFIDNMLQKYLPVK